jgi:tRNA U34 5-methylaminomethyl-2-thiouridine-forming methyltransferase MnmC
VERKLLIINPYPSVLITADGSHTLYVEALKEPYHSTFGAITESRWIFIQNGFRFVIDTLQVTNKKSPLSRGKVSGNNHALNILEIGFGTGLNALLTQMEAEKLPGPPGKRHILRTVL